MDDTTYDDIPAGHKSGFVALVGRPNVGKSTLLNAFMQQKIAIVTHRPQTTRTRQLGIITEPHYQMVFIDTPGIIRDPRHQLDKFMVGEAVETFTDADVVLWLVDGSEPPGPEDRAIAEQLTAVTDATVILAINKLDTLQPDAVMARTESFTTLLPDAPWVTISALNQAGTADLLQMLVDALPEGPRYYPADQTTDVFMRDIAAEMIREQIMLQLRDEVPYGTAVQVTEFKERDRGKIYINANIFIERESHKPIIIGKKGSQLRKIGAEARKEIEAMTESPVFLELWVKVLPQWRRDENALRRFGYSARDK